MSLGVAPPSTASACLFMSRVVKRLDSIPRMWTMLCLLVGLGYMGRKMTHEDAFIAIKKVVSATLHITDTFMY